MEMVWSKGCGSILILEPREQLVVLECQHPAVGVVDDHELPRAQQIMGDDERAQCVFRYDATGISNHVNVPNSRAQDLRQN